MDAGEVGRAALGEEAEPARFARHGEHKRHSGDLARRRDQRRRGHREDQIGLAGQRGIDNRRQLADLALGVESPDDEVGALDEAGLAQAAPQALLGLFEIVRLHEVDERYPRGPAEARCHVMEDVSFAQQRGGQVETELRGGSDIDGQLVRRGRLERDRGGRLAEEHPGGHPAGVESVGAGADAAGEERAGAHQRVVIGQQGNPLAAAGRGERGRPCFNSLAANRRSGSNCSIRSERIGSCAYEFGLSTVLGI